MLNVLLRIPASVHARRVVLASVLTLLGASNILFPQHAQAARSPFPVPVEELGDDLGPAEQIKPGKWTG